MFKMWEKIKRLCIAWKQITLFIAEHKKINSGLVLNSSNLCYILQIDYWSLIVFLFLGKKSFQDCCCLICWFTQLETNSLCIWNNLQNNLKFNYVMCDDMLLLIFELHVLGIYKWKQGSHISPTLKFRNIFCYEQLRRYECYWRLWRIIVNITIYKNAHSAIYIWKKQYGTHVNPYFICFTAVYNLILISVKKNVVDYLAHSYMKRKTKLFDL